MKRVIAAFLGGVIGALIALQWFPDLWFLAAPVAGLFCAVLVNPKPVFQWIKGIPAVMRERRARLTKARRAYIYLTYTSAYTVMLSLLMYASVALLVDPSFGGLVESPHTPESARDALAFMWSMMLPLLAFLYAGGVFSEFWFVTDRRPIYSDEELDVKVAKEVAWLARLNPVVLPFWATWQLFRFTLWSFKKIIWMMKETAKQAYNSLLIAGLFGGIFGYIWGLSTEGMNPIPGIFVGVFISVFVVLALRLYVRIKD